MNKHRMIIGTEIALLILIIGTLWMAIPAVAVSDSDNSSVSLAEFFDFYRNSLNSTFNKPANDIHDPQIALFYKKYVNSMELEKSGTVAEDQPAILANLLPDIQKINKNALNMPLKEAGAQLQDKDLAQFYAGFIGKCGVE